MVGVEQKTSRYWLLSIYLSKSFGDRLVKFIATHAYPQLYFCGFTHKLENLQRKNVITGLGFYA